MNTQEKATQYLGWVLEALDATDPDEGIDEGYTYAFDEGHWERFMLAGNGPTVFAYFLVDEDDDIDDAYLTYHDTDVAREPIPTHRQDELLAALRAATR